MSSYEQPVLDPREPERRRSSPAAAAPLLPDARAGRRILAAALVSATILVVLGIAMPWQEAARLWRQVSLAWLAIASVALVASHVATGVRLLTMLPPGVVAPLRGCIAASLWHGLAMILLPVRLGELALVDGLRRYAAVGAGSALAVLLAQRIYDLLLVALAFGLGVVGMLAGHPPTLLALAAALVVLVVLARFLDRLLTWLAALLAGGGELRARLHATLVEAGDAAAQLDARRVPALVAGTLLFWVTDVLALWFIFRAFHTSLDPLALLFVGAGLAIVHAVPLPTIGGLGLAEGGLAGLLTLTGMEPAVAVGLGVSVRLTLLLLHAGVIAIGLPLAVGSGGSGHPT